MKRRKFIKLGVSAAALAAIPACTRKLSYGDSPGPAAPTGPGLAPRRCELLDFEWRFKPSPPLQLRDAVALDNWAWTKTEPN
jgi:hypothetical protein